MNERIYDLFITHAWRYHDDWTRVGEMFDKSLGDSWRNFSVPWYDPALDPNTEVGKRLVHRWLEQQIVPTCGVIFCPASMRTRVPKDGSCSRRNSVANIKNGSSDCRPSVRSRWRRKRRRWSTSDVPGTPKRS